ncbi:MAG: glycogen synthase GlgA [Kiritimatiellales bacterium]|nr:glycogen synthase GlgA [Kiritimatiellales bacterium]
MKIGLVSSEIVPFASTGGLGDVASSLPKALAVLGAEVIRFKPLYQMIDRDKHGLRSSGLELHVPLGRQWYRGGAWILEADGIVTYFIENEECFGRPGMYGADGQGYADNFERFVFFQKAVVLLIDMLQLKLDIVHCNDWQTGLIPMFLEHGIEGTGREKTEKTIFTIHNLAYQGWFPSEKFYQTNLPDSCYTIKTLEFYGEISFLKGGLVSADAINTVSPTYAKEIQTEEFGFRLDGVLRERKELLRGITNGVDYEIWNPATDPYLCRNYSMANLKGKQECKRFLQAAAGLEEDPDTPLLGMITRLTHQKGIDLVAESIEWIVASGAQLIILGTGDAYHEAKCREWQQRWPDCVGVWIEFSQELAHQIEAGVDLFLMPSQFEPCGQNQLYSLKYGTIPVVHAVGGLEDTIVDADEPGGYGFKFAGYTADRFFQCLERALNLFPKTGKWRKLVRHAMKQDFSNEHMGVQYLEFYESVLAEEPDETVA